MTQLTINNMDMPETSRDKYTAYPSSRSESFRTMSGQMVRELSYSIMVIEYAYDYFDPQLLRALLAVFRVGDPLLVQFIWPDTTDLLQGYFLCSSMPRPVFAFSRDGTPYWHDVSFQLEGYDGSWDELINPFRRSSLSVVGASVPSRGNYQSPARVDGADGGANGRADGGVTV